MKFGRQRVQQKSHQPQRPPFGQAALPRPFTNKYHSSGLHDIKTIPIRGFLTRQVLLSNVVYSVTFEEQATNGHLRNYSGKAVSHRQNGDARTRE